MGVRDHAGPDVAGGQRRRHPHLQLHSGALRTPAVLHRAVAGRRYFSCRHGADGGERLAHGARRPRRQRRP